MAELNTNEGGGGGKHEKKRAKKNSTKIDMTPMVDLAFLLLTFFMLTTTFSKPQTMEINMPVKPDNPEDLTKIKESTAMTVILSENNKVYYYFGITNPELEKTDFGPNGIRKILLDRNQSTIQKINALRSQYEAKKMDEISFKKAANQIKGDPNALMVLIKADEKAKYKNVVDILDEMSICNIGKYALVDMAPVDIDLVKNAKE